MSKFKKTVDDFFMVDECGGFIDMAEKEGFKDGVLIWGNASVAKQLWPMVKEHVPETIGDFEAKGIHSEFYFYKFDASNVTEQVIDDPYELDETEVGKIILIVYLNDNFNGGIMHLKSGDETIEPKSGRLLLMDPELDYTYHTVGKGKKYMLRADIMYKLKTIEE